MVAIGYQPLDSAVMVSTKVERPDTLTLIAMPRHLPTVVANTSRASTFNRLQLRAPGFEWRYQRHFGVYFLADSIRKLNPLHTSDLFRLVPGFAVQSGTRDVVSRRPSGNSFTPLVPCYPDTYVDGAHVDSGQVNLVAPMNILAIEAYQAGEPAPVEFPSHSCGVILIWTR